MGTSSLREPLQESNEKNDLPLGSITKCIPLFWWRSGSVGVGISGEIDGEWPVDSVGLDNVSDEGGHGNASVFDFGVTKEGDGVIVGVSPDGCGGEFERIVKLKFTRDGRVSCSNIHDSREAKTEHRIEQQFSRTHLQDGVGLLSN